MKNFLYKYFPQLTIILFVLVIGIINFEPNTFLTGGDNLHPELNIMENIKRSIFSVWQEYQGTGLLGGMGHASDLTRQLFLAPFTLIFPTEIIRWIYTFTTLLVGTVGAYYLIKRFITYLWTNNMFALKLTSLTGSLFYLLNLSTLQSYFTPFEVFTAHFAFLPWLILITINYFEKPNYKNLLLAAMLLLIATPGAYVPTLFVVYMITAFIIAIYYFEKSRKYIFTFIKFFLTVLLINSFWLLPFAFFTLTSSQINVDAKINQMATEGIYLQNKEFGNITDVILLKGFWFNNVEPNINGDYVYMLSVWKEHINNPLITLIGYIIFGIILTGLVATIKNRNRKSLIAITFFIISILMLTTSTPPFSWINDLLREHVPLFGQIFRFPFTKFSILTSLSFSILFAYGISWITNKTYKGSLKKLLIVNITAIFLLMVFMFPVFKGNLFYEREKIMIPQEYHDTFNYFKSQNHNQRIANFPQHTFWGWNFYNWGYSGSGFLWYGIPQPILDRAFDVWSKENENYFWEINNATYSKNPNQFLNVLNKYDVTYILIDKNVISPASTKSLFIPELKHLIAEIPEIKKEKEFGNIEIYKVNLKNKPDNFITNLEKISTSNSYEWTNADQAYSKLGDYYSSENPSNYFPFRSIFTGKEIEKKNYEIIENKNTIDFISKLPTKKYQTELNIPNLVNEGGTLPVNIIAQRTDTDLNLSLSLRAPEIYVKNKNSTKKIWENSIDVDLFNTEIHPNETLKININGVSNFEIKNIKDGEEKIIGTANLILKENNILVLSSNNNEIDSIQLPGGEIYDLFFQDASSISLSNIKEDSFLVVRVQKTNDKYSDSVINPAEKVSKNQANVVNCDNFRKDYFSYIVDNKQQENLLRLSSENATPCISFYLQNLDHDQSYLISIEHRNIEGRGLHFWILNEDQKIPTIDTYLKKTSKMTKTNIIIPPMAKFGKSYSFHLDNISIGKTKSGNEVGQIRINSIPYDFITNISLVENNQNQLFEFEKSPLKTTHPNQSLYLVENNTTASGFLTLSQGYSPYWKAYEVKDFGIINKIFPFKNKSIGETLKVNNWKNGWKVNSTQNKIIIVYIPQYLQYIGFFFVFLTFLILIFINLRSRHHSREFDTKEHV